MTHESGELVKVTGMAISGIMVDGIGVDERVLLTRRTKCEVVEDPSIAIHHVCEKCEGSFREGTQNLNDADMIVVRWSPIGTRHVKPDKDSDFNFLDQVFEAFAIYGNKTIIRTEVCGHQIGDSMEIKPDGLEPKIIWARQKPYILNGDHSSQVFISRCS